MAYKNNNTDVVCAKTLITAFDAAKIIGVGRDSMRKMAQRDLASRKSDSYAIQIGVRKILIKRAQFLKEFAVEVGGNV